MRLHEITIGDQKFWDSIVMSNAQEINMEIETNQRLKYRDLVHFVDIQGCDFHFTDLKYFQAQYNLFVVGNWEFLDDTSKEDMTLAGSSVPYKTWHKLKVRLVRVSVPNPLAGLRSKINTYDDSI